MIKEALQYIISLSKPELLDIHGQMYSTKQLTHITPPEAKPLEVSTLDGLIGYIKEDIDTHHDTLLVQVNSPTKVTVWSPLRDDSKRECFIVASAMLPRIVLDQWQSVESFIISLQASFLPNEGRAKVLKCVGNIKEENVRQTGDDGVSQEVTVRNGIARVGNEVVPNPVRLAPYRSFGEVEQVESSFVFRMKDGPQCALFEADGGAWKLAAMGRIAEYLSEQLDGCNVKVIA